jgi:hypothetical protein
MNIHKIAHKVNIHARRTNERKILGDLPDPDSPAWHGQTAEMAGEHGFL